MFKKPFKLRSQNQLKSSEKKKFISNLKIIFESLSDDDISNLIPSKENVVKLKLTTFKNEDIDVYCVNKTPIYIDLINQGIKLPTIFMMWRFPHALPTLTTSQAVLNKLKNGADLFFPGIYIKGLLACNFKFYKNSPVCINLIENKAIVAIGISLMDKQELLDRKKIENEGKVVQIYHILDDYLYKMLDNSKLLQLGPPQWVLQENDLIKNNDEADNNGNKNEIENCINDQNSEKNLDGANFKETDMTESNESGEIVQDNSEKDSSDLLEYCFLKALKTLTKTDFPILPATFYAKYILTNVPEDKNMNLKKTKWKKFSVFLQEKEIEGLIKLQQMPKNQLMIASSNPEHPMLKGFLDPYNKISVSVEPSIDNRSTVQQIYLVSSATLPFFTKFGLKKNDELSKNDVRKNLIDYIRTENLADSSNPEMIILDQVLYQVLKKEIMSRGNLLIELLEKMNVQHKVSNCRNSETILHKGKMPMIEFETCLRTGNKKITLISNLESYGINANGFAKELQHKAAASTTIVAPVPGKKGPQVQVQGNQIAIAVTILKEKYHLTEKSMKGLEKAVKPKSRK